MQMKMQMKMSQQLIMTPQLQQAIKLLQRVLLMLQYRLGKSQLASGFISLAMGILR